MIKVSRLSWSVQFNFCQQIRWRQRAALPSSLACAQARDTPFSLIGQNYFIMHGVTALLHIRLLLTTQMWCCNYVSCGAKKYWIQLKNIAFKHSKILLGWSGNYGTERELFFSDFKDASSNKIISHPSSSPITFSLFF